MNLALSVVGRGAVLPEAPVPVPLLGRAEESHPVRRVDLRAPGLARWQKEPRLRRASPLTYFLIEAAEQALAGRDAAARARTGVVAAFSTGPLAYSRRFYQEIAAQGRKGANPALFPDTVFNSPLSHVAATLGLAGAAYALVGDETAWIAALKTAALWLRRDDLGLDRVLVLGGEEFDAVVLDAYRAAGWLRLPGFVPAEGAAALLLAREGEGPRLGAARDGFVYRNPAQARAAAARCLAEGAGLPFFPTAAGTWLAPVEAALAAGRTLVPGAAPEAGAAFTASAGWATLRALDRLDAATPRLLLPFWGTTHQIGAVELLKG